MTEEYVDIVDENNRVIGKTPRKEADEKILRMRASRIILFNSINKILLQKRSVTKSRFPDYWDFGIAETLQSGENYEEAGIRGLKEELGVKTNSKLKFLFNIKYDDRITKRYYNVYSVIYNGKIKIHEDEVSEIKYVTVKDLENMLKKEKFIPASIVIFNKYLDNKSV